MEQITTENYEVFYFDYLEGLLNEDDTVIFLRFLEEHPELKLDSEDLPLLKDDSMTGLSQFEKELIKQQDLNTVHINSDSVELLMIADREKQLTSKKKAELATYIQTNSAYIEMQRRYELSSLQPDLEQIYAAKKSLKKKSRIVPLWSYGISIAAAASVALFVFVDFSPVNPLRHSNHLKRTNSSGSTNKSEVITPSVKIAEADQQMISSVIPQKK